MNADFGTETARYFLIINGNAHDGVDAIMRSHDCDGCLLDGLYLYTAPNLEE
jgi:hypothetical protein